MIKRNRRSRTPVRQGWAKHAFIASAVVFALALVVAFVFDDMGLSEYLALRKRANHLEQKIEALKQSNAALQREADRLEHDPTRLEELARQRLGLVRQGETVYQIVDEPDR